MFPFTRFLAERERGEPGVADVAAHIEADYAAITREMLDMSLAVRPELQRARAFLEATPFAIPKTRKGCAELLDLAAWASNIAIAQTPPADGKAFMTHDVAAAKYGSIVEGLFANPYIQEQLLLHPGDWVSLVKFGKALTRDGASSDSHSPRRREAHQFIREYDEQCKYCQKPSEWSSFVKVGSGADTTQLFCGYSQRTYFRWNNISAFSGWF